MTDGPSLSCYLSCTLDRVRGSIPLHSVRLWYHGVMPYKDPQKQKEAQARYFKENQLKIQGAQNNKRNLFRRRVQEIKESTPCVDCGLRYPHYVMDFDHLPGVEKKFNVGHTAMASSMEQLEAEIGKCEIVCSNCHRHRSFMRQTRS